MRDGFERDEIAAVRCVDDEKPARAVGRERRAQSGQRIGERRGSMPSGKDVVESELVQWARAIEAPVRGYRNAPQRQLRGIIFPDVVGGEGLDGTECL